MISTIYECNKEPIWMMPRFYKETPIPSPEAEFYDVFGNAIAAPCDFSMERALIMNQDLSSPRGQIAYNMICGQMIIAIFREEIIAKRISGIGLEVLKAFNLVEAALLAGALYEAKLLLNEIPLSDWWSASMAVRYSCMCSTADAVNYEFAVSTQ